MLRKILSLTLLAFFAGCDGDSDTKGCIDSSKIRPDVSCIEIYDPVCGCNNITYDNECKASMAGITSTTKGECKTNN